MASAGTVTVDFAAETAKFTAQLKQVNSRLKGMETGFSSLATVAKGALGFLSVTAVASFGKAMFEAADAIGDMSARLGVSATQLSKLKYVASQTDVSFQSLSVGIRNLQKNLSEGDKTFKELGLSAAALKNLSLTQQFEALGTAFQRIQNPADKTRIAMELFGKAGTDLIPFLDLGPAGMRKLGDEAERVGAVMSDSTARGISQADEAIKRMKSSVEGTATSLLAKLAPAISVVADGLRGLTGGATELERLEDQLSHLQDWRDDSIPVMLNFGYLDGAGFVSGPGTLDRKITEIQERIKTLRSIADGTYQSVASGPNSRGRGAVDQSPGILAGLAEVRVTAGTTDPLAGLEGGARAVKQINEQLASDLVDIKRRLVIELAGLEEVGLTSVSVAQTGADKVREINESLAQDLYDINQRSIEQRLHLHQYEADRRSAILHSSFGDISSLMWSQNRTAFRIGKAAAIANATLSAKEGIMNAFATKPWYLGLALGVGAAARLYSEIEGIRGVQMQGFAEGGYTGNVAPNQVAGVVHGQEYVMDAATTARIGRSNLDAMRSGSLPGGNVSVHNYGGANVEVERMSSGEIQIMIDRSINQKTPLLVSAQLADPNSKVSKALSRNTRTTRQRA